MPRDIYTLLVSIHNVMTYARMYCTLYNRHLMTEVIQSVC